MGMHVHCFIFCSVLFAYLIIFEINFFLFKATGLCARVPV